MIDRECELAALKLLSQRSYSEQELLQRLSDKGFLSETINQVINHFRQNRYLDDNKLCQALYQKFAESGKYGAKAIFIRLQQRKLPNSVISEVLQKFDTAQELPQALSLIQRRFKEPNTSDSAKIARYLAARGFASVTIVKVLAQVLPFDID